MLRRIWNRYNLVPLFLTPIIMWGFDLIFHLSLKWIPDPRIWISLLTFTFPVVGYLLIGRLYSLLSNKLSSILPPEIPGFIGLLYAQQMYVFFLTLAIDGKFPALTKETIKEIVIVTAAVPLSTIVNSTYDGTLFAIPLTCLAMLIAGERFRRKYGSFVYWS